jgi:drug/metabolite transporter (DMT)-like permease
MDSKGSPAMIRLIAVVGVMAISFSAIFVRLADVSPSTAAFFRTAYAVPILLAFWWPGRRRERRSVRCRALALLAGLLLALDLNLWHRSIGLIGAGLATVLGNTQVLFVGLAAWLLYRERPSRWTLSVLPVALAAVWLISGLGRPDAYGDDPLAGAVLGVLTGVTYAGFLLVLREGRRGSGPPTGPLLDATVGAALTSLFLGWLDGGLDLAFHWPAHGWILGLALVSQSVGWLLIATALPRLPALEISILLLLQPMATVVWAYLIFAEQLSAVQLAGVVLVLGAVAVLSTRGSLAKSAGERTADKLELPNGVVRGG